MTNYLWYCSIFFCAYLVGNNETVISFLQEGGLIVAAISTCAPFIAEIFSEILVDKKNNEKSKFLSYKILSGLVNVLWVIVLCFLWIGIYKDKVRLQIILYAISLIISFYMYCVGKMEKHMDVTAEYDDSDYLVKENNSVLTLSDESSNAQSFEVKGKGEIKL